jgi:DNA polymerase
MKDFVAVDFETRSTVDLRKTGSKVYVRHPHTEIMSAVWMRGDESIIWCPGAEPDLHERIQELIDKRFGAQGVANIIFSKEIPQTVIEWTRLPWVAHNGEMFDQMLWENKAPSIAQPVQWVDTLHLARACDWPGSLGKLLPVAIPGAQKGDDTAMRALCSSSVVINRLTETEWEKVKHLGSPRATAYPVHVKGNPKLWENLLYYNIIDVMYLAALFEKMQSKLDNTFEMHIKAINLHTRVNRRGVLVDRAWLDALINRWQEITTESSNAIMDVAIDVYGHGIKQRFNPKSNIQITALLNKLGYDAASLRSNEIEQLIAKKPDWVPDIVIEVLAHRQNVSKATVGKLARIKAELDSDNCIRNVFVYHGAKTGRYSSVGVQLQNQARGKKFSEWPDIEQVTDPVMLSGLTRGCFVPRPGYKFVVFDYSAIEAKLGAWVVGQKEMLEIYANDGDVYRNFAGKHLYGIAPEEVTKEQRFVGKQAVLACQYQVGGEKLNLMCQAFGVDLESVNVTAEQVVEKYREAYPEYPSFWRAVNNAFIDVAGCAVEEQAVNQLLFFRKDDAVVMQLPSGRYLFYNNASVKHNKAPWNPAQLIPAMEYESPRYGPRSMYGGLGMENAVQGMARDVFHYGAESYAPLFDGTCFLVMHAHDEMVIEVPEAQAIEYLYDIVGHMTQRVSWAPDLPVGGEAWVTDRYSKEPLKGQVKATGLLGRVEIHNG